MSFPFQRTATKAHRRWISWQNIADIDLGMDQLRHLFFLLQWATIILTKSTTAQQHQTKLRILYLTDSTLTANKARLFESFLDKISNTTSLRRKVELRSQVLPKDSRTLLPILRVLNSSIAWTGIGIVVLDLQGDNLRTISLFSCLGLLFDIRTRPAEEDKVSLWEMYLFEQFVLKGTMKLRKLPSNNVTIIKVFEAFWVTVEAYRHQKKFLKNFPKLVDSTG